MLVRGCMADLEAGKTVAISGMGGVGKTSLGAAIAGQWSAATDFLVYHSTDFQRPVKQLALFPRLTFYNNRGHLASGCNWLPIKARSRTIIWHWRTFVAIVHTLPQTLLCSALMKQTRLQVDPEKLGSEPDPDTRIPGQSTWSRPPLAHRAAAYFSRADTHYSAIRAHVTPNRHLPHGSVQVPFKSADVHQLHAYTGGNPRLLKLMRGIWLEDGRSLSKIVTEMPGTPAAFHALLERFWGRLNIGERQMLLRLAVFRSPAPDDAWPDLKVALKRLAGQNIAQQDGYGGVSLLPVIRDLLVDDRQRFPVELHDQCHLEAADIRAARGEYTAATWHYSRAGEVELAVQVWFPHREQEMKRGLLQRGNCYDHNRSSKTNNLDRNVQ